MTAWGYPPDLQAYRPSTWGAQTSPSLCWKWGACIPPQERPAGPSFMYVRGKEAPPSHLRAGCERHVSPSQTPWCHGPRQGQGLNHGREQHRSAPAGRRVRTAAAAGQGHGLVLHHGPGHLWQHPLILPYPTAAASCFAHFGHFTASLQHSHCLLCSPSRPTETRLLWWEPYIWKYLECLRELLYLRIVIR